MMLASLCLAALVCVATVSGHGYLRKPLARTSLWRAGSFNVKAFHTDNAFFCGGAYHQKLQGGKCGICGDAYDERQPRTHEIGGKYSITAKSATYRSGQTIDVTVKITANHKGWFQFKICDQASPRREASQRCLDRNILKVAGSGADKYDIGTRRGDISVRLQLPRGMRCAFCVLQWRYHTANSWGKDKYTGRSGMGYGDQEEFYGCANVEIK